MSAKTAIGAKSAATDPSASRNYSDSETTRLLCAAAYLDRPFRDFLLKSVRENWHRAIAPNFGVNMAAVLYHCGHARRILNRRELWLLLPGLAAVFILFNYAGTVANGVDGDATMPLLLLLVCYVLAFAICYSYTSRAENIVLANFRRANFTGVRTPETDDPSMVDLKGAETGNVVIYSGFTPFVGSGMDMGGWSFALDLRKRRDGTSGEPLYKDNRTAFFEAKDNDFVDEITLEALYQRVYQNIYDLKLRQVTIEDKLYINGCDIREDRRFLDSPLAEPRNRVDENIVRAAMLEQNERHLRHYRCFRVVDWRGDMVLSIFLRLSKLQQNLFVEASFYLLTPVAERFRKVDALSPHFSFRQMLGKILVNALAAPFLTFFAPFILLGRAQEGLTEMFGSARKEAEKKIEENGAFDYGAAFSFRQWASSREYRRYFQKLDKEMYFKVLEKKILDSILTFLEEKNVDVSEFKQLQTAIVNNGVIVSGGNMTAENMSVGAGAKIEAAAQKVSQFSTKATGTEKKAS